MLKTNLYFLVKLELIYEIDISILSKAIPLKNTKLKMKNYNNDTVCMVGTN